MMIYWLIDLSPDTCPNNGLEINNMNNGLEMNRMNNGPEINRMNNGPEINGMNIEQWSLN